jgi:hypothetical protein
MNLHLNHTLHKIYKEILESPNNSFLNKKRSSDIDPLINQWMTKYLSMYHQLVREFNPSKISFKKNTQSRSSDPRSLTDLFIELYEEYPQINDHIDFDKSFLEELKTTILKTIKSKSKSKSKTISSYYLSDFINENGSRIYDSYESMSLIDNLKVFVTKSELSKKVVKILSEIIKHLEGCTKFMSLDIKEDLNDGMKYTYKYKDSELEFIIHTNQIIPLDNIYWRFLYARMKSISRTYNNDSNKKTEPIRFEIFLSNIEKKLPRPRNMFGPREINSGCTDYQTIIIWRKEEHMKLILHESIHFYNLDGSLDLFYQNENINMECNYQIGHKNETRVYEAYTESLTVFLNLFANSYQIYYLENPAIINLEQLRDNDFKIINKIRIELWNLEKRFTLMQVAKIFLHSNPESNDFADFLIEPSNCSTDRSRIQHKLEQRTSVLSYHILKGANMIFDAEFIEWIPDIFNPHPKSLYKFSDYINDKTNNPIYIKLVNLMIKYLKNLKTYNKNLRMTFYESEFDI